MSTTSPESSGQSQPITFTDIKLRFVEDGRDGLVAWASCVLNGTVALNNIGVRHGQDGRLFLTYPNKLVASGARLPLFHPISSQAAALLEAAILGKVRELLGPTSPLARTRAGGRNG